MKLTKRLQQVWEHIPTVKNIADVGTDHGYLAVAMIEGHKANHVIAIDVNQGPLRSAQQLIAEKGLSAHIETRLGNGLQVTAAHELDGAVMCGMGGFLMRDIISQGPTLLPFYVLQPQNGYAELRHYLVEQGYVFLQETMVADMGHMYQIWVVLRRDCLTADWLSAWKDTAVSFKEGDEDVYQMLPPQDIRWEYGVMLQREQSPLWQQWIQQRIGELTHVVAMRENKQGITVESEALRQEIKQLEDLL